MRRLLFVLPVVFFLVGCDERHHATIYKLKSHHIAMKDDRGKWWEYTLNNMDINIDIPWNSRSEMVLPSGGSWRPCTIQEEEEAETTATNAEETTVSETEAGDVDGAGDVGGDDGGAGGDSGGDAGGDGGGDGGGE